MAFTMNDSFTTLGNLKPTAAVCLSCLQQRGRHANLTSTDDCAASCTTAAHKKIDAAAALRIVEVARVDREQQRSSRWGNWGSD